MQKFKFTPQKKSSDKINRRRLSAGFAKGKRALVIVAHPDDETIWMGGFISKHPELSWTIFSLCRSSDSDRAPKFFRVCKLYKAKSIITNLEDEGGLDIKQTVPIIKKLIIKKVGSKKFDYIFTHGKNGEYGHPRHIGTYKAVKELADKKTLRPEAIFYFNYKRISRKWFSPLIARQNSDYLLKLTKKEFSRKKHVVTNMYGYPANGIDVGYCTNPEAFKVKVASSGYLLLAI